MQATHVSRSRIARQMTSKERCVGQKSRRAREMQALGSRRLLLHTGHVTEPSERWVPYSDVGDEEIYVKSVACGKRTHGAGPTARTNCQTAADHVFEST